MTHSTDFLTNNYLRLAPEVRDALEDGRPVVALESTVIAHGLPRPTNLAVQYGWRARFPRQSRSWTAILSLG